MQKHILSVLIFIMIFLMSCGSQKRLVTKYYVIEIPEDTSVFTKESTTSTAIDQFCEIVPVDIYPAYASQKIALRSDDYELIYYNNHLWAVRPSESFTRILQDYYLHTKVFKGVSERFWKIKPKYKLTVTIYKLEVLTEQNTLHAHMSFEFRLVEAEDEKLVLSHDVDRSEPLISKDLNLFARSVGDIFYDELNRFSQKLLDEVPEKTD